MKFKEVTTEKELDEVLQGEDAIIDFYKDNCMPCKMTSQGLQSIKDTVSDNITVFQVKLENVGEEVFLKNGVMGTPTVMHVDKGVVGQRSTGFLPPQAFVAKFVKPIEAKEVGE